MKQIEFRCLKELLTTGEHDAPVRDDFVAVWVDRRVLDELICWQTVEAHQYDPRTNAVVPAHRPTLSALVAGLLENAGHKPGGEE